MIFPYLLQERVQKVSSWRNWKWQRGHCITIKLIGVTLKNMCICNSEEGKVIKMVLVSLKDRNMFHCLASDCKTRETHTCFRITQRGIMEIQRSVLISYCNKYIGGVDLADIWRLNCNSAAIRMNKWRLKMIFYFLNVGTKMLWYST